MGAPYTKADLEDTEVKIPEYTEIGREAEYRELCATLRHYSNLRFLIMPLYFAINGALFLGFQDEQIRRIHGLWIIIVLFSALLAWVFAIVEYRLDSYMDGFVKYAKKMAPDYHWSHRKPGNIVTISFLTMYAAVAGCWWFFAWHVYTQALAGK
jgi:hypothetical protein